MPVNNIPDRLRVVIEAYGADPNNWPSEDQQQFSDLNLNEAECISLGADANAVDNWLMESQIESKLDADALAARVLAAKLGSRNMTHAMATGDNNSGLTDRLLQLLTGSFWRPVVAACMPLAIGMMIGATTLAPESDWMMAEQYAFALVIEE